MTKKFVIEDGVPLPLSGTRGRPRIYPWDELEIGQSFFVPNKTSSEFTTTGGQRRRGWKFKIRNVDGGLRVWRVA